MQSVSAAGVSPSLTFRNMKEWCRMLHHGIPQVSSWRMAPARTRTHARKHVRMGAACNAVAACCVFVYLCWNRVAGCGGGYKKKGFAPVFPVSLSDVAPGELVRPVRTEFPLNKSPSIGQCFTHHHHFLPSKYGFIFFFFWFVCCCNGSLCIYSCISIT